MAEHTPGPWSICSANDSRCSCRLIAADGVGCFVAQALMASDEDQTGGEGVADFDVAIANARLIAAAPWLLEALNSLANEAAGFLEMGLASEQPLPGSVGHTNVAVMRNRIEYASAAIAKARGES